MAAPAGMGSIWREEAKAKAPMDDAGADELSQAGLLGIITSSMAVTLAAHDPPPLGLDKNAYLLAITGAFLGGVAGVVATVHVASNNPRARRAAGRKLVLASLGPLAVVVGLSVAQLLW